MSSASRPTIGAAIPTGAHTPYQIGKSRSRKRGWKRYTASTFNDSCWRAGQYMRLSDTPP